MVGCAVLCCEVYCCVDCSCVVARFVTAPLSCSSCQQRQRARYPTMSLACCHTSAPQMYYSCGCVASSAHHLFRLCSHGYLLQDSEEACHQARSRTDVGALMESVRLQRKQLLLWDDALHSLQVLSPAGPFFYFAFSFLCYARFHPLLKPPCSHACFSRADAQGLDGMC